MKIFAKCVQQTAYDRGPKFTKLERELLDIDKRYVRAVDRIIRKHLKTKRALFCRYYHAGRCMRYEKLTLQKREA